MNTGPNPYYNVNFYQIPEVLSQLDPDPEKNGKPSDHMMVLITPITSIRNRCIR